MITRRTLFELAAGGTVVAAVAAGVLAPALATRGDAAPAAAPQQPAARGARTAAPPAKQPAAAASRRAAAPVPITVYKDAGCGCCRAWVEHLQGHGFAVTAHDVPDIDEVKANLGVPGRLGSCHTAVVGKYVVEGHVPADVIHQLLREQPAVAGLAVPGMPVGSPGMEMGARKDPYDIVAYDRTGRTRVYAKR